MDITEHSQGAAENTTNHSIGGYTKMLEAGQHPTWGGVLVSGFIAITDRICTEAQGDGVVRTANGHNEETHVLCSLIHRPSRRQAWTRPAGSISLLKTADRTRAKRNRLISGGLRREMMTRSSSTWNIEVCR